MKILFCKSFGIGNAVMAIPTIKAIASLGHEVHVLVGSSADDFGSFEVINLLKFFNSKIIKFLWVDKVPLEIKFDIAILSIPIPENKWVNGIHFKSNQVVDGRTRPNPATTGLVSWRKSEVEYQMDNARMLGFNDATPSSRFLPDAAAQKNAYYFGVGYKKDQNNFWSIKHWGNENYISLAKMLIKHDANSIIYFTGDNKDVTTSINPIIDGVGNKMQTILLRTSNISATIRHGSEVTTYVGNDTGMMHVCASQDRNVLGLFFLENSSVKNPPFCKNSMCFERPNKDLTPEEVFEAIRKLNDVE